MKHPNIRNILKAVNAEDIGTEDVDVLINAIRSMGDYFYSEIENPIPFRNVLFAPSPWSKAAIEEELHLTLPRDLENLWNRSLGLFLFIEPDMTIHGVPVPQNGLEIFSPKNILIKQNRINDVRDYPLMSGDLWVGEFRNDFSDMLLLRCNEAEEDYGSVLVAEGLSGRDEYKFAARSLAVFLRKYLKAGGRDYWNY